MHAVNHIEIFLFHTPLQLKPNVHSRTSVVFGRGSRPSSPLFSSSSDLSDKPFDSPSHEHIFIHLLHILDLGGGRRGGIGGLGGPECEEEVTNI